jgi:hypothetical protein
MLHGAMPQDIRGGAADDAVRTLLDAKRDGKVLHIGASFKNGGPRTRATPRVQADMLEFIKWGVFEVIGVVYRRSRDQRGRGPPGPRKGIRIVARESSEVHGRVRSPVRKAGIGDLLAGRMSRSSSSSSLDKNPAVSTAIIGART